jgi:SAM domain (Sterile alpha motif)
MEGDVDIASWLRGLGLEQYRSAFQENDIDAGVLLTLTDGDLRELGVASLGHRKRMLAAIAALDRATHTPDDSNGGVRAPEKTASAQRESGLAAGSCRAPPAHHHVRRPGRFDRPFLGSLTVHCAVTPRRLIPLRDFAEQHGAVLIFQGDPVAKFGRAYAKRDDNT